jgi:Ca-activated chloride channel family protein
MNFSHDLFEILGIPPTDDAKVIRRQYRLLARLYHPDVNASAGAYARFQELQAAYDVLSDGPKRAAFDQWLSGADGPRRPVAMTVALSPGALSGQLERQRLYAMVEIRGSSGARSPRTMLNLILVLDRSSSMKGRRLYYVKEAARRILMRLSPSDYFGIVAFNDRGVVVLPTSSASNLAVAQSAIDGLTVEGGTEIASGLRLGLQEAIRNHSANSLTHVIVLTDGRTYGDDEAALDLAARAAEQNIGITAMGLGNDWNDVLLDEIALRAGGR